uniref:SAM domain-containing protein n=1 Tax=Macrostomum lignano TaxID=282301 RepID=A0A1I8IL08_9PLAT
LRPLHVASFQGHFEAVHLLLKWHSCVNSVALGALTPLHLACQAGHYDVVKLLLCNNANPMLRADDGRSAFDVACEFGRYTIVQLLMSLKSVTGLLFEDAEYFPQHSPHRSAASEQQGYRRPPSCLHLAAKNGHTDVLRLLLSQPGVNVNRVTEQGSCLHMTAFYGHVEATKLLLEKKQEKIMDHQLDLSSLPPPPPEFFLDNFDNDEEFIFSNSNCKDYNCTIKQGIDPGLTNAHGRTAKEVIARDTPFARELHQILYERISAVAAVAIRDFCNLADPRSIAFRAGEHLTSAVAVTASGPSGPAGANSSTGSAAAAAAASAGTMCSRVLNSATNTPRSAAAPAAANGSVDSGLGPHRQSMVSTCSSGSLGSLPDDNSSAASVSSGELQYQQQQQHGWLREDWRSLTSSQQLHRFLDWCQLACYHRSIEEAGYDLATLVRCTPEDLNAAGVTNPRHRKRLRSDLARLGQAMQAGQAPGGLPDPIEDAVCLTADAALTELCCRLGLPDTASACLRRAGFQLVRDLGQMAWEDLEEIGISRLGHQKKLMLVIDRLRRPRHGPESDQHQPDQQQGTLRRQSAKSTVSCGTCTSSDSIAVQPDPFLAAAESQQQPPQSPPQPSCHSRSFSGSGAAQQSVKLLGRPIPVAVPEVPPQQPPPTPQRGAPPPPPKRVTSVRRCSGDAGSVTPCASPSTTPRHQAARPPAYENAAALADSPALARLGAAASAMPFANEDCGTIRHKPASASIAAAVASPQFGRAALFQQHRQHQHQLHHQLQHLPASPAFARYDE